MFVWFQCQEIDEFDLHLKTCPSTNVPRRKPQDFDDNANLNVTLDLSHFLKQENRDFFACPLCQVVSENSQEASKHIESVHKAHFDSSQIMQFKVEPPKVSETQGEQTPPSGQCPYCSFNSKQVWSLTQIYFLLFRNQGSV